MHFLSALKRSPFATISLHLVHMMWNGTSNLGEEMSEEGDSKGTDSVTQWWTETQTQD